MITLKICIFIFQFFSKFNQNIYNSILVFLLAKLNFFKIQLFKKYLFLLLIKIILP